MKALVEGRLSKSARHAGGRWKINPDLADVEWSATTMPRKEAHGADGAAGPESSGDLEAPDLSLVQAQTLKTLAQAALEEIRLAETRGELIRLEAVQKRVRTLTREAREAILRIPARVAAELALEEDPSRVAVRLEEELTVALQEMTGPDPIPEAEPKS